MLVKNQENQAEYILNEKKLSIFSFLFLIILFAAFFIPFSMFWGFSKSFNSAWQLILDLLYWIIPMIIVHEGLHGIVWAVMLKNGFKHIKFGFNKAMLSPYTHCNKPMPAKAYLAGALAPCIIMGLLPAIAAFGAGSAYYFVLSLICIWVSAGDLYSSYQLLKIKPKSLVLDHPQMPGFIILP